MPRVGSRFILRLHPFPLQCGAVTTDYSYSLGGRGSCDHSDPPRGILSSRGISLKLGNGDGRRRIGVDPIKNFDGGGGNIG